MKHVELTPRVAQMALELASEAQRVCERLFGILHSLDQPAPSASGRAGPVTEERVRQILKARRSRAQFFDPELFSDPAWDILLELYAAQLGHCHMPVNRLYIGADVPDTTLLRWIGTLEKKGLVRRKPDPTGGRQLFVDLTPRAVSAMDALLQATPAAEPLL